MMGKTIITWCIIFNARKSPISLEREGSTVYHISIAVGCWLVGWLCWAGTVAVGLAIDCSGRVWPRHGDEYKNCTKKIQITFNPIS